MAHVKILCLYGKKMSKKKKTCKHHPQVQSLSIIWSSTYWGSREKLLLEIHRLCKGYKSCLVVKILKAFFLGKPCITTNYRLWWHVLLYVCGGEGRINDYWKKLKTHPMMKRAETLAFKARANKPYWGCSAVIIFTGVFIKASLRWGRQVIFCHDTFFSNPG